MEINMNKLFTYSSAVGILFFLTSFLSVKASIPQSEIDALITLYNSTNGDNWYNNSGWKNIDGSFNITHVDQWYGITLSATGSVTSLSLQNNQLSGSIPTSLSNLSNLTRLGLSSNQLTGSIPTSLGNLSNLTWLYLDSNQLTGSIPTWLGNLSNLTGLNLRSNQLTGSIPTSLGNLSNLTQLYLHGNQLTGSIPTLLGNLSNLTYLYLGSNQFSHQDILPIVPNVYQYFYYAPQGSVDTVRTVFAITGQPFTFKAAIDTSTTPPSKFQWFKNGTAVTDVSAANKTYTIDSVVTTDFGAYHYTIINDSLPLLTLTSRIQTLELFDCGAGSSQIPLVELTALISLYNSTNGDAWTNNSGWKKANGEFDSLNVANWYGVTVDSCSVTKIIISSNNLQGNLPPELGDLLNLSILGLSYNNIDGQIPNELGNLTKLTFLSLNNNLLSGSIPSSIGSLANLENLYLFNNMLSGVIPPELGGLISLKNLFLYNNKLSGSIPIQIGNLSNLQQLHVASNELIGSIPPELGNLSNLTGLWIINTFISGSIPAELGGLANLEILNLSANALSGNIPIELANASKLQILELNTNDLIGEIPSALGNLNQLKYLYLYNNNLTGSIPTELGSLSELERLYLYGNSLVGVIPSELGNLIKLKGLYLHVNSLTGLIPSELGFLTSLQYLNLSANSLSGNIPVEIGNLANLQELRLSQNELSGTISLEIGNLTKLTRLHLNDNLLSGSVPKELGKLTNLIDLFLSHNSFIGSIPVELGQLSKMKSLWLYSNSLTGSIPEEFSGLLLLENAFFSSNLLDSKVPLGFIGLPRLKHINFAINKFTFSDLPRESAFSSTNLNTYYHAPQDSVDIEKTLLSPEGQPFTFKAAIDTSTTPPSKFQWFKNGTAVTDVSVANKTFTINNVVTEDFGAYHYTIINDSLPLLMLTSRMQYLEEGGLAECDTLGVNVNSVSSPCATAFSASIPNSIYTLSNYQWNFGDGSSSTDASPIHSYASPGSYTASLVVDYSDGSCQSTDSTQVAVEIIVDSVAYEDIVLSIPTTQINKVISASSSSFADAWPLTYQDEVLAAKNGFENGEQGVWRQSAGFVYNTPRLSSASPDLANDGSFTLNRFNWESADLDAIPGWQRVSTTTKYNSTGFETESKDVLGNYSGALYGYYGQLPVAVAGNSNQTEMAFTGFEQDTHGNWNLDMGEKRISESYVAQGNLNMAIIKGDLQTIEGYDSVTVFYVNLASFNKELIKGRKRVRVLCVSEGISGSGDVILTFSESINPHYWLGAVVYTKVIQGTSNAVINSINSHTGLNSLQVSGNATTQQKIIRAAPEKKYVLEGWTSTGNVLLTEPTLAENLGLTVTYKNKLGNPVGLTDFISPTGTIIEGWQRFYKQIIIPENATSFDLTFSSGLAPTAYFDDLRFYPADAVMQSYVYEPDTYRLSAQLDDNNYATFYYYDKEGKLFLLKKETVEGIKTLKESVNYTVKNN